MGDARLKLPKDRNVQEMQNLVLYFAGNTKVAHQQTMPLEPTKRLQNHQLQPSRVLEVVIIAVVRLFKQDQEEGNITSIRMGTRHT